MTGDSARASARQGAVRTAGAVAPGQPTARAGRRSAPGAATATGSTTSETGDRPDPAAGGAGLVIERVWTTAGVHPYDEVKWERRDVVMTNWRDGTVNFEQSGVEFPDYWSINAANIVTTKYFRGAVGTAQREWSLRQLIDRVVSAYRTAGEQHGYFATAADAEIFDHELTWMLLHQVFSFNSPVWFNVGTASPQQVSACFILAVDDSMDSILDWYKEEGLIFKGGSGAGVNLSRIRSSRELLSSGGTASGPVSFMRGADASAGTIKSGGATRRAAKMVILDVDHPDIEEFIDTKAREEDKIRALRDAGFDMDLGGSDITSVQYQNANNSVRVSGEFMRALEASQPFELRAREDGAALETVDAKGLFRRMAQAAWACADPGIQYDDTINDWHTCPDTGRITASNPCSEYMHLDNSSCNLASLNLLTFLESDGSFAVERFVRSVELVITAMDISICFADFPTQKIGETTRAYRQLGIGYANLGALLMASGLAYDSDTGRTVAAAITSLMTGTAYRRSAELAGIVGPYEGYARNSAAHLRVMRKHTEAAEITAGPAGVVAGSNGSTNGSATANGHAASGQSAGARPTAGAGLAPVIAAEAVDQWHRCLEVGEQHGWRNAQASVLAPTGCLTADTLVTTDRGLVRLGEIGDVHGDRWQGLDMSVSTDAGPQRATAFFVNGEEPTRRIVTAGGYRIQGTLTHRIKVVDPESGEWQWRRMADIQPGDVVPMQLATLVGDARRVPLPVLDQAYYTDDRRLHVPDHVNADLAELAGYFMGDGSLHAKGIRLCVAEADLDVVERIRVLTKGLFGLEPAVSAAGGYTEVTLQSVRLARWWSAAGLGKTLPSREHSGKGWLPRIPSAILETNDSKVYAAFLRGLFEADGTVSAGVASLSTSSETFAGEVRTILLALGIATTTRSTVSGMGSSIFQVRMRNLTHAAAFEELVGFLGSRKTESMGVEPGQPGNRDRIHLPATDWAEIVPVGHEFRAAVMQSLRKTGGVARDTALAILTQAPDPRLAAALGYLFEPVASNDDGGVQPTFDLSVPANVTYVAAGFVSHNTIGLMMDCDTTGVEPDLALVKFKKLVGGGSMQIVNQTIPRALRTLGYPEEQVEAIVEFIGENGHVVGAPSLRTEHYSIFDCAMGERSIAPLGHVRMMAAIQPFISGAISKTVNMPASATVEDVEEIYYQGWKLGLKALAIYRDNCKVGQPLSIAKTAKETAAAAAPEPERIIEYRPVRKRLPKRRPSQTVSFTVGGAEGYLTASSYPDDGLGEVFLKMSKQGSTLAGVMDAFSVALSIGLQYGVPLETFVQKFTNMRFEPAGMTDDPDIRMSSSVVDYIFRRLALDFLSYEDRADLGILTADERTAQVNEAAGESSVDLTALRSSAPSESTTTGPAGSGGRSTAGATATGGTSASAARPAGVRPSAGPSDAPLCFTCGTRMRPAGSCYVCEGCGSTSGCS